jgi:hypothetical protein
MSPPDKSESPEQADWAKLGGLGSFDDLISAVGAAPGIRLDPNRRVRLAIVLATLARRGEKFADWHDAANVLLPLVAPCVEARDPASEAVRAHWLAAEGSNGLQRATPQPPTIMDSIAAIGTATWITLAVLALLAASVAGILLFLYPGNFKPSPPKIPYIIDTVAQSGQFWDWLWRFYVKALMYRVNAVIVVAAIAVLWWRHARGDQKQRLKRARQQGRIAETLRLEKPVYLSAASTRRAGRALRRPMRFEGRRLDIGRTVAATVRAMGLLTPVNQLQWRTPDCLLLVDRASRNDQLAAIADALAWRLRDGGAEALRYEFCDYPDIVEAVGRRIGGHPVLTIEALARRHAGARVVIVSTGRGFFEPSDSARLRKDPWLYGMPLESFPGLGRESRDGGPLRPRLLPAFSAPPILLTPTPMDSWGPNETMLCQAGFAVTPLGATEDPYAGLLVVAEALASGKRSEAHDRRVASWATPGGDPLFRLLDRPDLASEAPPANEDLRAKIARGVVDFVSARLGEIVEGPPPEDEFDDDPFALKAMAGIAALALFPRIEPALTSALWRVATGHEASLGRLARLARLPWFRNASMPDWLRADIARYVRSEMDRCRASELWTELRQTLTIWTNRAIEGNAKPDGLPIYRPEREGSPWSALLTSKRETARPEMRAAVEEKLFLTFLETGEIVDDDLSIVLPRADRPTPAMKLVLLGFATVAIGAAALTPWLLAMGLNSKFIASLSGGEDFFPLSLTLASFLLAGAFGWMRLARSRWSEGNGWVAGAFIVFLSAALSQFVVAFYLKSGLFFFLDFVIVLVSLPYATVAAFAPVRSPSKAPCRNDNALVLVSAITGFVYFSARAAGLPALNITIFWYLLILIALFLGEISEFYRRYSLIGNLIIIYLFGTVFLFGGIIVILILRPPGDGGLIFPLSYICIIYFATLAVHLSLSRSWLDGCWKMRATLLGSAFLLIVLIPYETIFGQLRLQISLFLLVAVIITVVASIIVKNVTPSGPLKIDISWLSRASAALSKLAVYLQTIKNPVLGLLVAILLGEGLAALLALILGAAFVPLAVFLQVPQLGASIAVATSAWLLGTVAFRLYPVADTTEDSRKGETTTSSAIILLTLWGVAILPDNLLAWLFHSTLGRGWLGIGADTLDPPSLAWTAIPLALHFLAKDGSRALGAVVVGLLPFLVPISIYGVGLPGGFWAIGLTLILSRWMKSPERLAWLRAPHTTQKFDFSLIANGRFLIPIFEKMDNWRRGPWRLAGERLALAGAALAFVVLLTPEVTMSDGVWRGQVAIVDPQPVRIALFFLLGATALPRWPVGTVLFTFATLGFFRAPYQATLADTTVRFQFGLSAWNALELIWAYLLASEARRAVGAHYKRRLRAIFWGWSLATVVVSVVNNAIVRHDALPESAIWTTTLCALIGLSHGLIRGQHSPISGLQTATIFLELLLVDGLVLGVFSIALFPSPYGIFHLPYFSGPQIFNTFVTFGAPALVLAFAFAVLGQRLAPFLTSNVEESAASDVDPIASQPAPAK